MRPFCTWLNLCGSNDPKIGKEWRVHAIEVVGDCCVYGPRGLEGILFIKSAPSLHDLLTRHLCCDIVHRVFHFGDGHIGRKAADMFLKSLIIKRIVEIALLQNDKIASARRIALFGFGRHVDAAGNLVFFGTERHALFRGVARIPEHVIGRLGRLPTGIERAQALIVGKGVGILVDIVGVGRILRGGADIKDQNTVIARRGEIALVDEGAVFGLRCQIHDFAVIQFFGFGRMRPFFVDIIILGEHVIVIHKGHILRGGVCQG